MTDQPDPTPHPPRSTRPPAPAAPVAAVAPVASGGTAVAGDATPQAVAGGVIREVEKLATERLVFFSDAVVAIALTLLALELPAPQGTSAAALWRSLGANFDAYFAFCLSFAVIAAHWSEHHELFRWLDRPDPRLRWLNMAWLFTIVITPFTTRIISESQEPLPGQVDTTEPLRFALYAGGQVATVVLFVLLVGHMDRAHLLRPEIPPDEIPTAYRTGVIFTFAFGLSIPLFFATAYAWALWIIVPFGSRLYRRRRRARRHG